ncbi:MAG: 2-oxo acid dehydrogenase subunit E2 [Clostridia bacterium]|nr:2-oxo acid dehydrogenase subunit E2 [Clostridia bacterium]
MKKERRRLGDRKDAKLIRDIDELHIAMAHCYPNRTDNEAYISEQIELEPIRKWISEHPDVEFAYTFFHVIVAALMKLLVVRPKLNRFITNRRYYQRNERSVGFIVKKAFTDEAGEGMAVLKSDENTNIFGVHEAIKAQVIPCREGKSNGTENSMKIFKKLPNWITRIVFNVVRHMSDKGTLPKSITDGDSNHCSVFVTNLGSIGLKCGYHHLSNYGTSSVFVVIGEKKLSPFYDENGNVTMKETLDIGLTIDERIADGFYYARSVKILKKILSHPELLELPFETAVEI